MASALFFGRTVQVTAKHARSVSESCKDGAKHVKKRIPTHGGCMRFASYGAAGVLTVCLLSAPALANIGGTVGYSGNPSNNNMSCITSGCHSGGATPTVELVGPDSLSAGKTGQYKLIIRGGAGVRGGMNVAVDNTGASLTPGSGLRKERNELTHLTPKTFSNGEVQFDFSMVAPPSAGTVKIFGAGNSVNNNGSESGDGSATTSLTVNITGSNEPKEETGGCSSTGGAPVLVFALAAGMTLLRRRRS